jgi:kynureninase
MSVFKYNIDFARELDRNDELKDFRPKFAIPDKKIYMDGNSLGLMPFESKKAVQRVISEWQNLAIGGWLDANPPWFYMAEETGALCSGLVGAEPNEVIACGNTTVNIYSMLSTFYHPEGTKKQILADCLNFPSDIYALRSFLELKSLNPDENLILVPSEDGHKLTEESICDMMTDETALVFLPSVLYRSGQVLDIEKLCREAHKKEIIIGFDCSHSVGAIPHEFAKHGVDFAVWCGYKYLNAGPGSTAFMYINKKHFAKNPGMAGWFGYKKDKQFEMLYDFEHEKSAGGWQISTPPVLSLAPAHASLKLFKEAGIDRIREKSIMLTEYLAFLINNFNSLKTNYKPISPVKPENRTGHLAFSHPEAWRICEALKSRNIIPDYRKPDIIRIAPVALYNTFEEVFKVAEALKAIIDNKEFENFSKDVKSVS